MNNNFKNTSFQERWIRGCSLDKFIVLFHEAINKMGNFVSTENQVSPTSNYKYPPLYDIAAVFAGTKKYAMAHPKWYTKKQINYLKTYAKTKNIYFKDSIKKVKYTHAITGKECVYNVICTHFSMNKYYACKAATVYIQMCADNRAGDYYSLANIKYMYLKGYKKSNIQKYIGGV